MPDFTYSGSDERYYPSLSLSVAPGDTVTLDSDPGDGRFTPLVGKFTPSAPAVSVPEPVADAPVSTDSPEVGA